MKKILLSALCLVGLCAAVMGAHLLYLYTHCSFKPDAFRHSFVLNRSASAPADLTLQGEVSAQLGQPFHYLGCGRQMTAYESADHRYVIKFFNPRAIVQQEDFRKWGKIRRFCSLKWISKAYFKRRARFERLFQCYQTAFDELRLEAGLIYVHLDRSTALSQTLCVVDEGGKSYKVALDTTPFVLQHKAELVTTRFERLIREREWESAKQHVLALHRLFVTRAEKGYTDRVQTIHNNYGFIGDLAVQIDMGGIVKERAVELAPAQDIYRVFSKVAGSLSWRYPPLAPYLAEFLETCRPAQPSNRALDLTSQQEHRSTQ